MYDDLAAKANRGREEFDKKVKDKKALVEHLRKVGEDELAKRISKMFQIK